MTKPFTLLRILLVTVFNACHGQQNSTQMKNNTLNSLLCDPEKGACETTTPMAADTNQKVNAKNKPIKIIYFTDPICSSCWGIEPQLRKLQLEYGNDIEFEYHMGGLLPDWSYNSGGISKPSDVAHHWDEVSKHYNMPIDGDVWLEDPLPSSYPPSIAFKAAQMQDKEKAKLFLRRIREMVFLEKKNITKWEYIAASAIEVGLDTIKLKQDFENKAQLLFQSDLDLARKLGVRGFPTLIFSDSVNNQQIIYGFKPYIEFENAVLKLYPKAIKNNYDKSWEKLFAKYNTLTTQEFSELSHNTTQNSESFLQNLFDKKELKRLVTKNGVLWIGEKIK
jgi:putative protein-disulfide isomerase